MRYIRALCLTALTITAFAAMAAAANAETTILPTVLLGTGTINVVIAESSIAKTKFTGIVNLTGEGYQFRLTQIGAMASLGEGLLTFLKAQLLGKTCKSFSDVPGTVLVTIEWHVVLALGGGPGLFIVLILVILPPEIECEGTTIRITGSQGVDAAPYGTGTILLTAETGKKCPFNVYTNDNNEMITGGLKSEVGGLKAATCQEVEGTQKYLTAGLEVMQP